jgi:hypothetical protein
MGDLLMTDENRVREFLDGLAELSNRTGVGVTFGGSGSESMLRLIDSEGNELFEVRQLSPSGFDSEAGLDYRLVFTGTLSFSSAGAATLEPSTEEEADEAAMPARRFERIAASVVRVKREFGSERIESSEGVPVEQEDSLVSG